MDRAPTELSHALVEAGHATALPDDELAHARLALAQAQAGLAQCEARLDLRDRELIAIRGSHELLVSTLDAASRLAPNCPEREGQSQPRADGRIEPGPAHHPLKQQSGSGIAVLRPGHHDQQQPQRFKRDHPTQEQINSWPKRAAGCGEKCAGA